MTQIQALQADLAKINKQINVAKTQERKQAISTIRQAMQEHGIDLSELAGAHRQQAKPVAKIAPKYRNPATGATWTGRGREPLWIKGKERAAFAV